MAELNSYELVGVKEDVADWISNLAPDEYPFSSMIGKAKATQTKFEWQIDHDEAPAENAQMEGLEWSELDDSYGKTTPMTGYTQKLAKAVKVTGDADAQASWGRGSESNYQVTKKGRALRSDLEYAFLKNGASVAEVKGASPRMLGGYQSMISSIDGGATVSADPLTAVETLIVSTATTPTEDDLFNAMAALWKTGGKPEILMVNDTMKDVISGMQSSENRVRVFENTEKVTLEVNTITDPLGQTVKVVYNRHMPDNTAYIFNPDDWQEMVFRAPTNTPVPSQGDYKKTVIHMDSGLRHRNPWASAAVLPKPAS